MVQSSPEQLIDQLHTRKADIAICTEKVDQETDLVIENCYEWHHALVVPQQHPLSEGDITLERLASSFLPIVLASPGGQILRTLLKIPIWNWILRCRPLIPM